MFHMRPHRLIAPLALAAASACQPTVKLESPDKPIEINLNVRVEQEIRVRIDRDLDREISDNPALFGKPSTRRP